MTTEEQDKRWAELPSSQKVYIEEKFAELVGNSTDRTAQRNLLIEIYGYDNLNPQIKVSYDMVLLDLKKVCKYRVIPANLVYTSQKQFEKVEAITKLLNVAAWLNGDWKPDWENIKEYKWYYNLNHKGGIIISNVQYYNSNIVYFRTKELAEQAVQILGETILLALSTDYQLWISGNMKNLLMQLDIQNNGQNF